MDNSPFTRMPSDGLTNLATLAADCLEVKSVKRLVALMDWLQSMLRFDAGVVAMLRAADNCAPSIVRVFNHSYDEAWVVTYQQENYAAIDPVVARALASPVPIKWSAEHSAGDGTLSRFFEAAQDHGLHSGIGYVVKGAEPVLISVANVDNQRITGGALAQLRLVGCVAAEVFAKGAEKPCRLSRRETDVLHWIAEGKSSGEIAMIIGVRERTVKFHLENIFEKLGVNNRCHAVSKALRTGLI